MAGTTAIGLEGHLCHAASVDADRRQDPTRADAHASPSPAGFASAAIRPAQAFWNNNLNQYNLPYDAVRTADDPEQALMDFLMSTYEAAASAGKWDRTALESPLGLPRVPRKVVWD